MNVTWKEFRGGVISDIISDLSELRIDIFREYPYLYEGSLDYEKEYLGRYTKDPDGVVIGTYRDNILVGAATGLPLRCELEGIAQPFKSAEFQNEEIYYIGEVLFRKEYRGKGLGSKTLSRLENLIQKTDRYSLVTLCTVQRHPEDSRKPSNYRSPDPVWEQAGFQKREDLVAYIAWQEIGEDGESLKPLTFWIKRWR